MKNLKSALSLIILLPLTGCAGVAATGSGFSHGYTNQQNSYSSNQPYQYIPQSNVVCQSYDPGHTGTVTTRCNPSY